MTQLLNATAKEVVEMKINGKSFFGRNIVINQSNIVIDGVNANPNMPNIKVEIMGHCDSVSSESGSVYITQSAGKVETNSGDVECRNIYGSVSTKSGGVECGDVSGSVSTMSGDIRCKTHG